MFSIFIFTYSMDVYLFPMYFSNSNTVISLIILGNKDNLKTIMHLLSSEWSLCMIMLTMINNFQESLTLSSV